MPQSLFYMASKASGFWYCDRSLKRPQARLFDKRYGIRVIRLAAAIKEKEGLGWRADDIMISTCSRQTSAQRKEALRVFDGQLQALEKRYLSTD
jgi:hypothetical protein